MLVRSPCKMHRYQRIDKTRKLLIMKKERRKKAKNIQIKNEGKSEDGRGGW